MKKPITPAMHGIIDYLFSGAQMILPSCLHLNRPTVRTYQVLGTGFLAVNAITDTPAGIRKDLTFRQHERADLLFLGGLALLSLASYIRKDRRSACFHAAFFATAVGNYLLTDYGASGLDENTSWQSTF